MQIWVIVTILAAAVQTLRFTLQKRLKSLGLSTGGATFSRFLFAFPLASFGALLLMGVRGYAMPPLSPAFWGYVVAGGVGQIVGTFCTVALFSERSFAVGIAFTKTETVQVAAFSALFLGEAITGLGLTAILIGLAGVLILSRPPAGWGQGGIFNRAMGLGILAGAFLGASAIGYRGATLAVDNPDALFRAVLSLACVTAFQTLAMLAWLRLREPGQIAKVLSAWRATLPVGVTGVLGSLGWFTAFALQNAAYVRSVGQVELIFSVLVSTLFFREKPTLREVMGIGLLAVSIIMIVTVA